MRIIPHRPPFLMIDEITELVVMKYATAKKVFLPDDEIFKGHFPTFPVVPGVLLIEAMAQAGAVAIMSDDSFKGKIAFFAGIDSAKFKRKVLPGDEIIIRTEFLRMMMGIGFASGEATVNGELAAKAEFKFAIG